MITGAVLFVLTLCGNGLFQDLGALRYWERQDRKLADLGVSPDPKKRAVLERLLDAEPRRERFTRSQLSHRARRYARNVGLALLGTAALDLTLASHFSANYDLGLPDGLLAVGRYVAPACLAAVVATAIILAATNGARRKRVSADGQ